MAVEQEPVSLRSGVDLDAIEDERLMIAGEDAQQERHAGYDEIEAARGGRMLDRQRSGIYRKILANILPWYTEAAKSAPQCTINIADPILTFQQAFLGIKPSFRVPFASYDEDDVAHADMLERLLRHDLRRMMGGRRFLENGDVAPMYGTAVNRVTWDLVKKIPRWEVRIPRNYWCVARDDDGFDIAASWSLTEMSGYKADRIFPKVGFQGTKVYRIIEHWSDDVHVFYSPDLPKNVPLPGSHTNALGKVPECLVQFRRKPGSIWGESAIWNIIELQKEFNRRQALETEWLLRTLYAPWIARNARNLPKRLPYGPGAVIAVEGDGGLEQARGGDLGAYQWRQSKQELMSLVKFISDTPDQYMGAMDSDIVTGKGFLQSLMPANARIEARHREMFPAYERVMALVLEVHERIFPDEPVVLLGVIDDENGRGQRYAMQIMPEEIAGYYEVEVYQDSSAFLDISQKILLGLNMVDKKTLSVSGFMEFAGVVEDRVLEQQRIEEEQDRAFEREIQRLMMQAQLQQGMMAPQGMPPQAVPPQVMPPQGPAQGLPPGLPAPAEEVMPPEQAQQIILEEFSEFLRGLSLKGRCWLGGGILDGNLDETETLDIWLENMIDKATIVNAVKNDERFSWAHGHIEFHQGPPDSKAIEVTEGTVGSSPVEQMLRRPGKEEMTADELEAVIEAGPPAP